MSGAEPNSEPPHRGAAVTRAEEAARLAAAAAENQQQQQQRQQQRRSRRARFDKNSPNTFTFKLLPAPQQLLRTEAAAGQQQQQRMQLQRVIPPNARDKPQQPLPAFLQQHLDRQEIAEEELRVRLRAVCCRPAWLRVCCVQTGDCYFPQDGYDYSQHLVSLGEGTFVSFDAGDAVLTEETEGVARMRRDREGRQVLKALEAAEDFEEIDDDFVAEALSAADGTVCRPDDEALLWGSRPSLLPAAVSARLLQGSTGGGGEQRDSDWGEDFEEEEGDSEDFEEAEALSKGDNLRKLRAADPNDTQAYLSPEDGEESDAFSAYEECFDEFLKSQERKPAIEGSRPGGASRRRRDSWSSAGSGTSSRSSSSSESFKRDAADGSHICEIDDELKEKTLAKLQEEEKEAPSVHAAPLLPARARPSWDGETIMSARSGLSVQPRSIRLGSSRASKLPLNPHLALGTGGPLEAPGSQRPRRAQLPPTPGDAETAFELPEVCTLRVRGETPQERKERKARAKEAQRLMRANKKANKQLLKEETKKVHLQQARISPFDVRPGVRCFKI
ncbi:hypothetical protein Esti_001170 [Eimeria stiedai]